MYQALMFYYYSTSLGDTQLSRKNWAWRFVTFWGGHAKRPSTRLKTVAINALSCCCVVFWSYIFSFSFYPPADGVKPQSLSSAHFHVFSYTSRVDFNSVAFAIQLVFWRVLRFPR